MSKLHYVVFRPHASTLRAARAAGRAPQGVLSREADADSRDETTKRQDRASFRFDLNGKRFGRFGAALLALALCAGPAAAFEFPKFFGGGDKPAAPGAPVAPGNPSDLECPEILVDAGNAELRVPAGAESSAVRYQLSIGRVARECAINGDQLAIKVGVEGAAVLGPLGAPGSFFAGLRVGVRRIKDEASLSPRVYRISATVPAGAARGDFRLVADPISVPFTSVHAAEDYEIVIAFAPGGGEPAAASGTKTGKKKRGKRRHK